MKLLDAVVKYLPELQAPFVEQCSNEEKRASVSAVSPSVMGKQGRNNTLKSQVSVAFLKGKTPTEIAREIHRYDKVHHSIPLFEDFKEGFSSRSESDSFENALQFTNRIISSLQKFGESTPLPSKVPLLPSVEAENIPLAIRAYVLNCARRLGVDPGPVCAALFVAMGASLGTKVRIYPRLKSNHEICPNLWGLICGPPGSLKSVIMNEVFQGLREIDNELRVKGREDEKVWKEAQPKDKKSKPVGTPPIKHRLIIQDTTPEKLIELLQYDSLLMELDEIALLISRCSQKGRESYRASLLQTWQGTQAAMIDTIAGGERYANPACLSIFGGTQPDKAKELFGSIFNGKSGDGLENRFQCIAVLGNQKDPEDICNDLEAAKFINNLIRLFHSKNFSFLSKNLFPMDLSGFLEIRFPPDVAAAFKEWDASLRARKNSVLSAPLQSHLSKMDKLIVSLTAIFYLCRRAYSNDHKDKEISLEDFNFAKWWTDYFEIQFLRFIGTSSDPVVHTAHTILEYFVTGVFESGITVREIHRTGRTGVKNPLLVKKAIELLESHNLVFVRSEKNSTRIWLKPLLNEALLGDALTAMTEEIDNEANCN